MPPNRTRTGVLAGKPPPNLEITMQSVMQQDISKLPKWAQQRITILERDLRYAHDQMKRVRSNEPTRIVVSPYSPANNLFLPDNSTVRFMLECGVHERNYIDVTLEGTTIMARTDRWMRMAPYSGNSVGIGFHYDGSLKSVP